MFGSYIEEPNLTCGEVANCRHSGFRDYFIRYGIPSTSTGTTVQHYSCDNKIMPKIKSIRTLHQRAFNPYNQTDEASAKNSPSISGMKLTALIDLFHFTIRFHGICSGSS